MKQLLLLVLLFRASLTQACICYQTTSFNLMEYDESETIIEVEILERVSIRPTNILPRHDSTNTTTYSLNFIGEEPGFNHFKIKVLSFYKGNPVPIATLRTDYITSSCYWEPTIGKKYLLYADKALVEKGEYLLNLPGCARMIESGESNYRSEKQILTLLTKKRKRSITIDQKELLVGRREPYRILEGQFKHKKREGIWVLYEPLHTGDKIDSQPIKVLLLEYHNGQLLNVTYYKPTRTFKDQAFTRNWHSFYSRQKL